MRIDGQRIAPNHFEAQPNHYDRGVDATWAEKFIGGIIVGTSVATLL